MTRRLHSGPKLHCILQEQEPDIVTDTLRAGSGTEEFANISGGNDLRAKGKLACVTRCSHHRRPC